MRLGTNKYPTPQSNSTELSMPEAPHPSVLLRHYKGSGIGNKVRFISTLLSVRCSSGSHSGHSLNPRQPILLWLPASSRAGKKKSKGFVKGGFQCYGWKSFCTAKRKNSPMICCNYQHCTTSLVLFLALYVAGKHDLSSWSFTGQILFFKHPIFPMQAAQSSSGPPRLFGDGRVGAPSNLLPTAIKGQA